MPKKPLVDPWSEVEDLRGTMHYDALAVGRDATPGEIRAAYRAKARVHHPDKGGAAAAFARIQLAFETLSDPARRATYDALGAAHAYRYIPGVTPRAPGGEDVMLDELDRLGLRVDPGTQLVALCEVCARPSNKTCFACGLLFCDFCERKMHWKGAVGLHYPVRDAPGTMREKIAKKQLEAKRVEDAKRRQLQDPNFRSDAELADIRAFKEAAAEAYGPRIPFEVGSKSSGASAPPRLPPPLFAHVPALAKYYMWAQTTRKVFLVVHVPTGYKDKELDVRLEGGALGVLTVQPEDSAPVVRRRLARPIDETAPMEIIRGVEKTRVALAMTKAEPGAVWDRVFDGDPTFARCLEPPYRVHETNEEVVLEMELPFWIEADDVTFAADARRVSVRVSGALGGEGLARTFWRPEDAEDDEPENGEIRRLDGASDASRGPRGPNRAFAREKSSIFPDPSAHSWTLLRRDAPRTRASANVATDSADDPVVLFQATLVKRPPTRSEAQYKRGEVQDNRHAPPPWGAFGPDAPSPSCAGQRLFAEDRDHFGLEDDLVAMCFADAGAAFAPAKPWRKYRWGEEDRWVTEAEKLPERARATLERLLEMDEVEADQGASEYELGPFEG